MMTRAESAPEKSLASETSLAAELGERISRGFEAAHKRQTLPEFVGALNAGIYELSLTATPEQRETISRMIGKIENL